MLRFCRTAAMVAVLSGLSSLAVVASANAQFGPGGTQVTPTPTRDTLFPGPGTTQVTPTPTRGTPSPGPVGAQQQQPPLVATLIGAAERPEPGDPDGIGSAAITLDPAQGTLCYTLHVVNIERAIAAHIHQGGVDAVGDIVVHFNAPSDGNASDCIQGVERELLTRITQDPRAFYVNVHNAEFPDGAVRGQLGR
jgi:hypothetical protein